MRSRSILVIVVIIGFGLACGRMLGNQSQHQVDRHTHASSVAPESQRADSYQIPGGGGKEPLPEGSYTVDQLYLAASDLRRDPAERNQIMERISTAEDSHQAFVALMALANNQEDIDVYRSWAIQHLGLMLVDPYARTERSAILNYLRHTATAYKEGTLIRRESLFALAVSGDDADKTEIIRVVRERLATEGLDRDLYARFAGMFRLHDQRSVISSLCDSPQWSVRMASNEALQLLKKSD